MFEYGTEIRELGRTLKSSSWKASMDIDTCGWLGVWIGRLDGDRRWMSGRELHWRSSHGDNHSSGLARNGQDDVRNTD